MLWQNRFWTGLIFLFVASPSWGWLKFFDADAKVDLYWCLGGAEKKQVWIVNGQRQRYTYNFFLQESVGQPVPFEANTESFSVYLQSYLGDPAAAKKMMTDLADEKASWPVNAEPSRGEQNPPQVLKKFAQASADKWKTKWVFSQQKEEAHRKLALDAVTFASESQPAPKPKPPSIFRDFDRSSRPGPSERPGSRLTNLPFTSPYGVNGYSSEYRFATEEEAARAAPYNKRP